MCHEEFVAKVEGQNSQSAFCKSAQLAKVDFPTFLDKEVLHYLIFPTDDDTFSAKS